MQPDVKLISMLQCTNNDSSIFWQRECSDPVDIKIHGAGSRSARTLLRFYFSPPDVARFSQRLDPGMAPRSGQLCRTVCILKNRRLTTRTSSNRSLQSSWIPDQHSYRLSEFFPFSSLSPSLSLFFCHVQSSDCHRRRQLNHLFPPSSFFHTLEHPLLDTCWPETTSSSVINALFSFSYVSFEKSLLFVT